MTQVEVLDYRTKNAAAEEFKTTVLNELATQRRLIEDLNHGLEKAQTEENQAKQDLELAKLRMKEVKQGVAYLESIATKTQLEVEQGRHSSSVEELVLVKSELEKLQNQYISLINDRDAAAKRAEEENSKSKEIEQNVEELTSELITLKGLLDSSHATHIDAEEDRINVALDWEKEKLAMEKEIEQGELQLQELSEQATQTNEIESKLGAASDLLLSLRAEFFTYMEGKLTQDLPACAEDIFKEFEEMKKNLEKAKDEVQFLRVAAASLKTDLEKEKEALEEARTKKSLASLSVSSLEDELNKVNTELSKVTAEKGTTDEPHELKAKLEHASEEAEHAKSAASLASEELRKVREEMEEAKAAATAIEMRLQAVLKEIEATKSSEELAASAIDSLQGPEETEDLITINAEEYHSLSKMARESEDLANKRVILAIDRIQEMKESESISLQKLEEAKKEIEERKKALKLAVEKAEMAQEAKLAVEQELRSWREENEQRRKAIDGMPIGLAEITNLELSVEVNSPKVISGATCQPVSPRTYLSRVEVRNTRDSKVRRSFFPRLIMFLARKKVQTLKS
jgi:Weak chloroplast movement under blue light